MVRSACRTAAAFENFMQAPTPSDMVERLNGRDRPYQKGKTAQVDAADEAAIPGDRP
jgi:hypothetical protein